MVASAGGQPAGIAARAASSTTRHRAPTSASWIAAEDGGCPADARASSMAANAAATAGQPPSSAAIHEAEAGALCHAVLEAARAAIPAG